MSDALVVFYPETKSGPTAKSIIKNNLSETLLWYNGSYSKMWSSILLLLTQSFQGHTDDAQYSIVHNSITCSSLFLHSYWWPELLVPVKHDSSENKTLLLTLIFTFLISGMHGNRPLFLQILLIDCRQMVLEDTFIPVAVARS